MTESVLAGASCLPEVLECRSKYALESSVEDLLWADGLLLGTPENFGYMSGALKHFFDCTFYHVESLTQGLPFAIYISAGNDGTGAERSIQRIATGLGWKEVMPSLIVRGEITPEQKEACRTFGEIMAAGLISGRF